VIVEGLCGAWKDKNNPSKTYIRNIVKLRERDLLKLPRLVKKVMENKCWKQRDGTHTFRKVAMCKWQMDDPEARVKSSLSDCTWVEDLSMDFSSRHLRTYEAKRSEEHLYYFS
jgi:hypothetical protein